MDKYNYIICPSCNSKLELDAKFCGKCGISLGSNSFALNSNMNLDLNNMNINSNSNSFDSNSNTNTNWEYILPVLKLWVIMLFSNGALGLIIHFTKSNSLYLQLATAIFDAIFILGFIQYYEKDIFNSFSQFKKIKDSIYNIIFALVFIFVFMKIYVGITELMGIKYINFLYIYKQNGWPLWSAFITIAIIPAIFEELAFRGFIMKRLQKIGGNNEALIIQAIMFSVLHMLPTIFISHFVIGVVLGTLYQQSKSIYPGIIVHLLWNSIVIIENIANL